MRGPSAPSAIAFVKYAQQYKSDWFDSCLKRRRIPPAKGELLHRYRDRYAWKYYHAGARGKKHFSVQGYGGPGNSHFFLFIRKWASFLSVFPRWGKEFETGQPEVTSASTLRRDSSNPKRNRM